MWLIQATRERRAAVLWSHRLLLLLLHHLLVLVLWVVTVPVPTVARLQVIIARIIVLIIVIHILIIVVIITLRVLVLLLILRKTVVFLLSDFLRMVKLIEVKSAQQVLQILYGRRLSPEEDEG